MGEFTKSLGKRLKPAALPTIPRTMLRLGAGDNYKIIAWPHSDEGRHVMPGTGEEVVRGFEPMLCEHTSVRMLGQRRVPVYTETDEQLAADLMSVWDLRKWSQQVHELSRPAVARGLKPQLTVWYVSEDLTLGVHDMHATDPRLAESAERRLAALVLADASRHVVALAPVDAITKRTGL